MHLLRQHIRSVVVEGQRLLLALPIVVSMHLFAGLYHQYLFAVFDFRSDDDLGMVVDGRIVSHQSRGYFIGLLVTKRDVLDGHEFVIGMQYSASDKDLRLIFFIIVPNLVLVVHLLLMLDLLDWHPFLIQDLQRVASLVPHYVVRNEVQRLHLSLLVYKFVLLLLRLLLPGVHRLLHGRKDLSRDVYHDWTLRLEGTEDSVVFLVIGEFVEEKVDLFEHGLPSEDEVVEIVDDQIEIALQNVLLEGV
jgi:hypothetical protein